ncbi:hypothetical protein BSI_37360 [Bacillus inaquosorum KCTC 13429]|uniref:Uncharacterized protein n=1 Tax=Bacillus inaquosorum KCTC 13429 TaxID=1236548 RepID=A0A9W5LFK1_9BACI|nr:hypothetical protein BSI_37360 [Bacillus inaquosorum KCTC 13429]
MPYCRPVFSNLNQTAGMNLAVFLLFHLHLTMNVVYNS